jgi:hypothetical protein
MNELNHKSLSKSELNKAINLLEIIPLEVRNWAESLPLNQRGYILSLCHIISAASTETRAEFLDNYTADGLVSRMLEDRAPQELVKNYLKKFHIDKELSDFVLKSYIHQFYIHSAQDLRAQPELYLKAVLRLFSDPEERNNFFNYILGFEVIKMIFQMSWLQHERLYRLQRNQEHFIKTYIKPVQYAHRINGIIVPQYENVFFAKRSFFIKKPEIKEKKLLELVMATFTTDTVMNLGFLMTCNLNFLVFDYEYIFNSEPECIFLW